MPPQTAKLFASGRSQAVRLPKQFRFQGAEVRIRRHSNAVILAPLETGWDWLPTPTTQLDQDFAAAAQQPQPQQHRPALADL